VNVDHSIITKMFENEVNSSLREKKKEKKNPFSSAIVNLFYV